MKTIRFASPLVFSIGTVLTLLAPVAAAPQEPASRAKRFIVTVDGGARPEVVAKDHGITPTHTYHSALNGFAGSISELARAGLMGDARVRDMEIDQVITASETQVNPPWGLDRIDQRALPLDSSYNDSGTGDSVTVYMLDSGIRYSHVEFGGRASFGFDAFGGDGSDCHGHGSHTAGTVGGSTYGVAKAVQLVSVRVLGCDNTGAVSGIIAGLDWVTAHHAAAAVASMSIQSNGTSAAWDTAIQNAMSSGVIMVIAAGNKNDDACKYSPSRVTNAITVGASDSTDTRASFSSYGSCVDWFGPGVGVLSAWNTDDNASRLLGGTSMATPHVAGIAALYLQAHPGSSQVQVRDALLSFATKGVIANSSTPNNHLLYNREIQDGAGDYVSPVTAITSPVNGATLNRNSSVNIQASASDNNGLGWVTRVEFYVNNALTCTDTAAPYTCSWHVPNSRGATVVFQSKAFDADGNAQASPFVSAVIK